MHASPEKWSDDNMVHSKMNVVSRLAIIPLKLHRQSLTCPCMDSLLKKGMFYELERVSSHNKCMFI